MFESPAKKVNFAPKFNLSLTEGKKLNFEALKFESNKTRTPNN
jgi:hypothetical protein